MQWGLGAVGNATWSGVPLSAVLDRAKVKPGAIEVILEGADEGEVDKSPKPSGKISFCRSLPLSKAQADVLLAYEMNGEKLSATHGFPVRAIVPGWYAMASVKWVPPKGNVLIQHRPASATITSVALVPMSMYTTGALLLAPAS